MRNKKAETSCVSSRVSSNPLAAVFGKELDFSVIEERSQVPRFKRGLMTTACKRRLGLHSSSELSFSISFWVLLEPTNTEKL